VTNLYVHSSKPGPEPADNRRLGASRPLSHPLRFPMLRHMCAEPLPLHSLLLIIKYVVNKRVEDKEGLMPSLTCSGVATC
jgi:hypothetical protein